MKKLLKEVGIEPERLRLEWISAGEGKRFSNMVKEFTEEITKLGPNPLKKKETEYVEASSI